MNPNMMDCWLGCSFAELHYREHVAEGQREQFITRNLAASVSAWHVPAAVRRQLGSLLVRAGQRLLGVQAVAEQGVDARRVAVAA